MRFTALLRRALPAALVVVAGCSGSSEVEDGGGSAVGAASIALPEFSVREAEVVERAPAVTRAAPQSTAGTVARGLDRATLSRLVESRIAAAMAEARRVHPDRIEDSNVTVAVAVRDLRTGKLLYGRGADTPLRPASNLKVLTAGAALLGLGADASFETRFLAGAELRRGLLRGDLVVQAGGDPLFQDGGDGSTDHWSGPLVAALRAAGVQKIDGKVVLDEGTFEAPGPAPEWPSPSQHWRDYCGLSGGFSANGGLFHVRIAPGRNGRPASVELHPRHHGLEERIGVTTEGKDNDVRLGATSSTVTVGGSYGAGLGPYERDFRHPDPVDLFGHTVVAALRERDMLVRPRFERRRRATAGELLHVMRSPIAGVLRPILSESNNPVTDQLFLTVGHRLGDGGTRTASARAVAEVFRKAGHSDPSWTQADGSGLSRANRVTASQMAEAVSVIVRGPAAVRDAFLAALPESARSGSLSKRMGGTPAEGRVRAKTGFISGVSGLSGVILDDRRRPRLGFSILVQYPRVGALNTRSWKPMQDGICADLCAQLDGAKGGR